jgi:hypothetical protein
MTLQGLGKLKLGQANAIFHEMRWQGKAESVIQRNPL